MSGGDEEVGTGVDARTIRAYDQQAHALAPPYESAAVRESLGRYLRVSFPRGARVLDLGAGTGRDLALMASEGCHVYGVEPSAELRRTATRLHPELADRIVEGYLPAGLPPIGQPYDGIVCAAVLQHVPKSYLFDAAYAIKQRLRDHGRLLVSIPSSRPDIDVGGRDPTGRLFNGVRPEELALLFERIGFRWLDRWDDDDALGRAGIQWVTMLFVLQSGSDVRPLDRVEAILSRRERKVATYKFALFRALAELATTRPHLMTWRADGWVGVPIESIAERWLLYYWPLLEAGERFRQIAARTRLGFERELGELIHRYRMRGRLPAFVLDWRRGTLSADEERERRTLLRKLRETIRDGPVTHAGGGSHGVFEYRDRTVWMEAALWSELSLMGHWILDALVLRWADKTCELSGGETSVAEVVELLRRPHDEKRDQSEAREIYSGVEELVCVWTGRRLAANDFDVDHVLPYSLWRSNDLWNLLPASSKANNEKRDRLPARGLLDDRCRVILKYWEAAREKLPRRFDAEALELTGDRTVRLERLFQVVRECVEVTAVQRGVEPDERWHPSRAAR